MVGSMAGTDSTKKGKPNGKHPEKKLNAVAVRNAKPGKYADGNGLYLIVEDSGSKHWILRTVIRGRRRELGLGGLMTIPLSEAREEAARMRRIARKGGDPLAERRQERRIVPTFEEAARQVHAARAETFRNVKHRADWLSSLAMYAFPAFGSRPIDQVTSADILTALTPIWNAKAETARRVRQRIRIVFDWSKVNGHCADNPVEGVTRALPRNTTKQEHLAALPYAQVPAFLEKLWEANTSNVIKLAFEFLILTAARTGEVIGAVWLEIDLDAKVWTIPAERMKAKVEHRIPLTSRCMEILRAVKELPNQERYVFPGRSARQPLSNMSFLMVLRRMKRVDITPHGFRSSFRDWAEEKTNMQRSVVEAALAHRVESKVEAAYLRSDLFEKRRRLMESWTRFVMTMPMAKVVKMREREA
jgi:integrase